MVEIKLLNPDMFITKYQQRSAPLDGRIIKRKYIRIKPIFQNPAILQ
jgi:hypothetical protein